MCLNIVNNFRFEHNLVLILLCKRSLKYFSVYIDFGTDLADTVSLNFALTGTATTRTWEIKTTQLECSNPNRYPFHEVNFINILQAALPKNTYTNFKFIKIPHYTFVRYN